MLKSNFLVLIKSGGNIGQCDFDMIFASVCERPEIWFLPLILNSPIFHVLIKKEPTLACYETVKFAREASKTRAEGSMIKKHDGMSQLLSTAELSIVAQPCISYQCHCASHASTWCLPAHTPPVLASAPTQWKVVATFHCNSWCRTAQSWKQNIIRRLHPTHNSQWNGAILNTGSWCR